jgi:hypothetical protein
MTGVFDTLIQLRSGVPEVQDVLQVESEISALYPPSSSRPSFQVAEVVERDGSRFVRLSTMAGSMHFMLRRGVKMKTFPRILLCSTDREAGHYEYFS